MTAQILALLLAFALVSCHTAEKKAEKKEEAGFSGSMQGMAQDVKNLLPYLFDRKAFEDPKNHELIAQDLKQFAAQAHHVKPDIGTKYIGDDLLIQYSLNNLTNDLNRSVKSFDGGQTEYARSVAKASLNYCFQCHSITEKGGKGVWDIGSLNEINLAPLERADLLVAARKYDKALTYMESLLGSDDFVKNHAFDYEALLRRYLALIIRVENAPHRALKELNKILKRPDTPRYIAEQTEGWRKSLKSWSTELARVPSNAKMLFANVDKRFKKAQAIQHYEKDHAGDVEYLRATVELHEGMKYLKTPEDQAHALLLLGRAYEVLDELGSWNLHETYFEACVDRAPKSEFAKQCYNRLEASLMLGYSGSSGTHLPPEERDRLKRLKDKLDEATH